jgi:sulfonate transport system substrate-binding protein
VRFHGLIRLVFLTFFAPILLSGLISLRADETKPIIRIGYQKSGAFLLVRSQGLLEKRLEPLGYQVQWKEFPSGPPLLEALNSGSLDIGHSGDAPLVFAQAAGVPFQYIGSTSPAEESAGILVPKDSPIRQVSELKGKRVAFAKGSSSHYLLAKALLEAGLTFSDIKPIFLQPADARAAFQSGNVEAWAIWDPYYAAGEIDGNGRILRDGKGLSPHREFYFGRRDYLTKNGAMVDLLLAVLRETGEKAIQDPKGTAAFLASKLGIAEKVLEKSELRKQRYYAEPMNAQSIAEQQEVADTFARLGLLPQPVRIADLVFKPSL